MITQVDITTIQPARYNPRKLSEKNKQQIKQSLERFGFVVPIVVNKLNNTIVGGHQRYEIAKELGYKEIPVQYVMLTEEEERELNIRLNKNVGRWDTQKLKEVFKEQELNEWGFTPYELQTIYEETQYEDNPDTQTLLEMIFQESNAPEVDILGRKKVEIYFTKDDWEKYNEQLYLHINNGVYATERAFVYDTIKKIK